jgi:hypothetical protein
MLAQHSSSSTLKMTVKTNRFKESAPSINRNVFVSGTGVVGKSF